MNDRSRQMRALYRASAVEQMAQLARTVDELRHGTAGPSAGVQIETGLRLLTGDAALVGMMDIAGAMHAAEERAAEGAWDAVAAAVAAITRDLGRPEAEADADVPASVEPAVLRGWVRLQSDAIDELSNRLLELSTAYNRLAAGLVRAVRDAPTEVLRGLADDADIARRQLDEVLGAAWSIRLASVEDLLQRLSEQALEIARGQGKPLQVRVDSGRVELERAMLSAIEEPLLQLIRNAIGHGVEEPGARGDKPAMAVIALEARVVGGLIEIAVEDDGRGIIVGEEAAVLSPAASLELRFDIGGAKRRAPARGLDAVRTRIDALGGIVALWSRPGLGTRSVIAVPASLVRERALLVECGGGMFALPDRAVSTRIRIGDYPRRRIAGGIAIRLREGWTPLWGLDEVLGLPAGPAPGDDAAALVIEGGGRRRAFAVDRIEGELELLRRPTDAAERLREVVSASSVLADGRTALWPSVPALLSGQRVRRPRRRPSAAAAAAAAAAAPRTYRVLIADDSPIVIEVVKSILSGSEFALTTVSDGAAALHALKQELPDLLVSDVEMPQLDGLSLLRRVRERWPRLPVVMLTTRDADEDRRVAMALGASAYLLKAELDDSRMVELVRGLIDAPTR